MATGSYEELMKIGVDYSEFFVTSEEETATDPHAERLAQFREKRQSSFVGYCESYSIIRNLHR